MSRVDLPLVTAISVPDLPWAWIVGAAVFVVVVRVVLVWTGGDPRLDERSRRGPGYASGPGPAREFPQPGEQRALLTAANAVREALDRQTREMSEQRTFWSRRLDELERKIDSVARARAQIRETASDLRPEAVGGEGGTHPAGANEPARFGASLSGRQLTGLEPAWSPGPDDQPVEVRDGVLVASRSLPPAGYLSSTGSGPGRVYLNADVQLTEFSLPRWAEFFDLQEAKPYAAYRTIRPAEVQWDAGLGRGELIRKGVAEAI